MALTNTDRRARYEQQNRGRPLTARQQRRLRHREHRDWPADWGTPEVEPDYGCCALDDAKGTGHDGPCAFICDHCQGTGKCPACNGSGDDGSGLDYTCMECGGGSCPRCQDGLEVRDQ